MSSTKTVRIYADSEFVSASSVNAGIFNQELQDDGYVVEKPSNVYRSGTSIFVEWTVDDVTSGTFSAVDARVAAHTGGSYTEIPTTSSSESESSDNSGDEQTKLTLDTGLLPAGVYLIGWYCEIKGDTGNTTIQARLYISKNGAAEVEKAKCTWDDTEYHEFGGSFPIAVLDGDQYELRLAYERLGAGSNSVTIQRAHLYCVIL